MAASEGAGVTSPTAAQIKLLQGEEDTQDILHAFRAIAQSLGDASIAESADVGVLVASLDDGALLLRLARRLAELRGVEVTSERPPSTTPTRGLKAKHFSQYKDIVAQLDIPQHAEVTYADIRDAKLHALSSCLRWFHEQLAEADPGVKQPLRSTKKRRRAVLPGSSAPPSASKSGPASIAEAFGQGLHKVLAAMSPGRPRLSELSKQCEELRGRAEATAATLASKEAELCAVRLQAASTDASLQRLQERLDAETAAKASLQADMAKLQGDLAAGSAVMRGRDAELDSLAAKHAAVTAELAATKAAATATTAAAAEEGASSAALVAELAQLREENAELEAALEGMEGSVAAERRKVEDGRAAAARQYDELKRATAKRSESAAAALATAATAHSKLGEVRDGLRALAKDAHGEMEAAFADLRSMGAALVRGVGTVASEAAVANKRFLREAKERRRVFNLLQELRGNIRVFCRVRPVLPKEGAAVPVVAAEDDTAIIVAEGEAAAGAGAGGGKRFEFDRVFGAGSSQQEVYDEISPVVNSALDGFHCCIFAYGQTGSGKTHTMQGQPSEAGRGVYFRALSQLFEETVARSDAASFTLTVSMVEIYNEAVRDLLVPPGGTAANLDIRSGPAGNYLPDAVVQAVHCPADVQALMDRGALNRSVGATDANEQSSRSHSLLMINISGRHHVTGATSEGRLVLVDLAGSERVSKSGAAGQRMKEAQNINKSLSALGDVIGALTHKTAHVPFRNSKLTWLLKDSLGKDNKALMIVQVSPVVASRPETLCSLNFAARVRKVEQGQARKHGDSGEGAKLRAALARARAEAKAASGQVASMSALLASLKAEGAEAKAKAKAAGAAAERASKEGAAAGGALRSRLEAADKALREEKRARAELAKKLRAEKEGRGKAEAEAAKRHAAEGVAAAKKAASAVAAAERKVAAAERKAAAADAKAAKAAAGDRRGGARKAAGAGSDSAALKAQVAALTAQLAAETAARKEAEAAALAAARAAAAGAEDDDAASFVSSVCGGEDTLRGLEELHSAVRASLDSTAPGRGTKRAREEAAPPVEGQEGGPSPSKEAALDSDGEGGAGAFSALNDTFDLRCAGAATTVTEEDSDEEGEYTPAAAFFSSGEGSAAATASAAVTPPPLPTPSTRGVRFGAAQGPTDDCTPGRGQRLRQAPGYAQRSAAGKSPKVTSILRGRGAAPKAGGSKAVAAAAPKAVPQETPSRVLGATGNTRATRGKARAPRSSVYGMMGAALKSVGIKAEASRAASSGKATRSTAGGTPMRRRKAAASGSMSRPASRVTRSRARAAASS